MLTDYQILQRNPQGFAGADMEGAMLPPKDGVPYTAAYLCAFSEDDNTPVTAWLPCQVADGRWFIHFSLPQGGLYRVEVRVLPENTDVEWGSCVAMVHHVGVGEVYLLTGQSNMSGYSRDIAYDPAELGVHMYANDGVWKLACHPLNDPTGTIYPENAEYCSGASPALSFGRAMRRFLHVPIGLVPCALGGSCISQWHPLEKGDLYRGMMRRLPIVGSVSAVIWYQGCHNACTSLEDAQSYRARFESMVHLWREQLGDVPFVTVQINRYAFAPTLEKDRRWGTLRQAQLDAMRNLSKVCMVSSSDIPLDDPIHSSAGGCVMLGERMAQALMALTNEAYADRQAPYIVRAVRTGEDTVLLIPQRPFVLRIVDEAGLDFSLEDEQGLCSCRAITHRPFGRESEGLVLTFERPIAGSARVHGGWRANVTVGMPRNLYGMPLCSFYDLPVEEQD